MEPRVPAVRFLACLACRAPKATLESLLEEALSASSPGEILRLACRFGLASSLGNFACGLPSHLMLPEMTDFVIEGLRAESRTRQQLQLLARLAGQPEVRETNPVAIKGAGLVLAGLTTPSERNFVDVDLLVAPASIAGWKAAAERIGAAFRPSSSYELGVISLGPAQVDLHAALPGAAGSEHGPSYAEVLAVSEPACPGIGDEVGSTLRVPLPGVQREIGVHHFLHHHGGEPAHALRTLQDLACLESQPDAASLAWAQPDVGREVAWMNGLARSLGQGTPGEEFLARLAAVAGDDALLSFSDEVDRWLVAAPQEGKGRAGLIVRRLFPPSAELALPGEPRWRTAVRRLARPVTLGIRYSWARFQGRRDRSRSRAVRDWRNFLGGSPP